jgi:hypothetical protein
MRKIIAGLSLLCLVAAHGAHADRAAANVCAASLQPHARLVFDFVSARPQPELSLRALLTARVRELIFSDKLMMNAARPAAEAASQCLRIARGCTGDNC